MSRRVAIWSRTRSTACDNTENATLTLQHGREAVVTLARARTTLRGKRRHREGAGVSLSAAAAVCRRRGERDVKRGRVESATPVQQAETIICARRTNTVASDKAIFDRPPHKCFAQANDDLLLPRRLGRVANSDGPSSPHSRRRPRRDDGSARFKAIHRSGRAMTQRGSIPRPASSERRARTAECNAHGDCGTRHTLSAAAVKFDRPSGPLVAQGDAQRKGPSSARGWYFRR